MKTEDKIRIVVNDDIKLEEICLDDASVVYNSIDQHRSYLAKWLPFVNETHKIQDTYDFILYSSAAGLTLNEYVFRIEYQGAFAGLIGFRNANQQQKSIELGYWLAEDKQGKGLITISLPVLIDYYFSHFEYQKILIKVAVDNHKSLKIPRLLGFHFEGTALQAELMGDGSYADVAIFSLSKQQRSEF